MNTTPPTLSSDLSKDLVWPFGSRVYDVLLPDNVEDVFERLDEIEQQKIAKLFESGSLVPVRCHRYHPDGKRVCLTYYVNADSPSTLYSNLYDMITELLPEIGGIEPEFILSTISVYDNKGFVYKMASNLDSFSRYERVVASEVMNALLDSLCEVAAVRWVTEIEGKDETCVYISIENNRMICESLGLDPEYSLLEEFCYFPIH